MKASSKIIASILIVILFVATSCSRNYYSGNGKFKSANCGCPGQKG